MNLDLLFNGANLFVLPFWTLMIVLPKWGMTRKVIESFLPFVALAGLYLVLFVGSLNVDSAEAFANPQLADLARLFADERVMATGWVHFLVMDLFVGRWIYQEGQRTGIWTTHSLVLCLFAGPLGLLSHIVTRWVTHQFFSKPESDPATGTTDPAAL
ncbi:DUF4281 domain-containing protein [Oculatella sp. LEGE 06141]|uniref:ABA4-like family protein n=1 Tax=Oculatella sp. LEGE 06141 TaxID=1828648 RepID=UPI00187DEA81|nr:ABA4-like family protein [Oculatella sp. LEGE 06141]MBE9177351.1 DUF4281 domain-containing protein [Oculatella sp. LEGE 06141]